MLRRSQKSIRETHHEARAVKHTCPVRFHTAKSEKLSQTQVGDGIMAPMGRDDILNRKMVLRK